MRLSAPCAWTFCSQADEGIYPMCGIVGYTGSDIAKNILVTGLKRMEYRGYDSSGVALEVGEGAAAHLDVIRRVGKVAGLESELSNIDSDATCGIGHTRWATHGEPSDVNAHPHYSESHDLAIVHNGIIENYLSLKTELERHGYHFASQTDTEVLIQLVQYMMDSHGISVEEAVPLALRNVIGAYAIVIINKNEPGRMIAARKGSPLVIGVGDDEYFVGSDATPIIEFTNKVVYLEEEQIAYIERGSDLRITDLRSVEQTPVVRELQMSLSEIEKGGFPHFMLKEIFEQPQVIVDGLSGHLNAARDTVLLPELDALPVPRRLHIVACGTSYHSGLWARHLIEPWAKVPVQLEIASEFRYRESLPLDKDDMVLVISQSGETEPVLNDVRHAKQHGHKIVAFTRRGDSTLAQLSDLVFVLDGTKQTLAGSLPNPFFGHVILVFEDLMARYFERKESV